MEVRRAYKFRIYPDIKRQSEINNMLILAQRLYNRLLEKSIQSYKHGNSKISMSQFNLFKKAIIEENKDFLKLYSQTRCEIEYRVIKAYQNFFRRVKEKNSGKKIKAGFPRFKSVDRYKSITYPQDNGSFSIEANNKKKTKYLHVSRLGRLSMEMHRKIEGKIKTLTIKREGKLYYVVFTAIQEIAPPKVEDTKPVGIDLGLNNFIALSDGTKIAKPKFFKKKAKRIALWQRRISKRKKSSKRREKAKLHLQNEWKNITNQSTDFMYKLSNSLVKSGYTSFVIEKLSITNMVKNHILAQSIQNASWNKFIQMLSYKAESAGMKVLKVNARDTSKKCSSCGNLQEMPLSSREYRCNKCGLQMDRDTNAAINILKRATFGQRKSHAQGDSVRLQKRLGIKELRTGKIRPLQDVVSA